MLNHTDDDAKYQKMLAPSVNCNEERCTLLDAAEWNAVAVKHNGVSVKPHEFVAKENPQAVDELDVES